MLADVKIGALATGFRSAVHGEVLQGSQIARQSFKLSPCNPVT